MNKYIIRSFVECSLQFTTLQAAKEIADRYHLTVCKVFYLDEHTPKFIGYGLENENGLMNGNEFNYTMGVGK